MELGKEIPKREFNKWIEALRSGEYGQTKRSLQDRDGFCCLGVLIDVCNPDYRKDCYGRLKGCVPEVFSGAKEWQGEINFDFNKKTGETLVYLNDGGDFTFNEIADLLEAVYVHRVLE